MAAPSSPVPKVPRTESPPLFGDAGIDHFYHTKVIPAVDQYEKKHRRNNGLISFFKMLFFILCLCIIVSFIGRELKLVEYLVYVLIAAVGLSILLIQSTNRDFNKYIIKELCACYGLKYCLKPSHTLIDHFNDLNLLPTHTRYTIEDGLEGTFFGVDLNMVEAVLTHDLVKDYEIVFSGLLISFSFPKPFHATTIISADTGIINRLSALGYSGERVRLEDPVFERKFEVYSTDQIEARYLLTPTFMERMTSLRKTNFGNIEAAFHKDKFLLALPVSGSWLEGDLDYNNFRDPKILQPLLKDIAMIHNLITALNLRTKSKI